MGRRRVLAVIFTFLIVSATSKADTVFDPRKLVVDSLPTQTNNSSSQQIVAPNIPVEGEKKVNSSTVNDKKSEIGKEKPENPEGSNDLPKPESEKLNSTIVSDGSSQTDKQKPKDPQLSYNAPKDLTDQSTTTVDGNSKADNEQPKDPQVSGNAPKDLTDQNTTTVDGNSKAENEQPKDPQISNQAPKDLMDQNTTTVDGNSKAENEQPKDPQVSNQTPKDLTDQNTTTVGGNLKPESEQPKDPQVSNNAPKDSKDQNTTTVDGNSKPESEQLKDPQVSNNVPKDSMDQNTTTVGGNSKPESEQPKDPQVSNDPSKLDPKEPNSTAVDGGSSKGEKENPKDPQPQGSNNSPKLDPDSHKNDNVTAESPPPVEKKENEEKKNINDTINSEVHTSESCQGATKMCRVEPTLLACIQTPQDGSAELFLVVQNEGEKIADVNFDIQPPLDSSLQAIKVPKHQSKKIGILSISGKGAEIVVNSGDGSCRLQLERRVSVDNIMQQVSLYSKRVTPIHGAYFLFFLALLFGGTWACCKLRKKRHQGGVPYQELEMGMPETASAANGVVAADGWDQDWDDDNWDEENAVKSPGGRAFGNISANGLTSRSTKKDGWENDWDD